MDTDPRTTLMRQAMRLMWPHPAKLVAIMWATALVLGVAGSTIFLATTQNSPSNCTVDMTGPETTYSGDCGSPNEVWSLVSSGAGAAAISLFVSGLLFLLIQWPIAVTLARDQ